MCTLSGARLGLQISGWIWQNLEAAGDLQITFANLPALTRLEMQGFGFLLLCKAAASGRTRSFTHKPEADANQPNNNDHSFSTELSKKAGCA